MKHPTLDHSSTSSLEGLCNLIPPESLVFWRNWVATWGWMPKLAKLAISGGRPGLAFVAISSGQAFNHRP